jgi:aryl-alcohol dehydrogenase-like predicted oxidoreductase
VELRAIGKSDLKSSIIGFGAWGISGDLGDVASKDMERLVQDAYNLGINYFDTAPAYGWESGGIKNIGASEKILGCALKDIRNKVIIATKCGIVYGEHEAFGTDTLNSSRESLRKEVDDSLLRLKTDYIDLYQAHWPDPKTPIEETFSTLHEIKNTGKVRYIGVCNYSVSTIEKARKYCEIISSQNIYNMIQRNVDSLWGNKFESRTEKDIMPYCKKHHLGFIPYSPFCQGLLTGAFLKEEDFQFKDVRRLNDAFQKDKLAKNLKLVNGLLKIANRIGKPMSQMVLNWYRKDKRISSIIAGPTTLSQLKDNVSSVSWDLEDEVYNEINMLLGNGN